MQLEEIEEGERLLAAYHDAMGRRASVDVKATKSDVDSWFHQHAPELIAAAKAAAWRPISEAPKDHLIDIWIRNSDGSGVRWADCYYDQITDQWRTSRPGGRLVWVPAKAVTHWRPIGPLPDPRREAMDNLLAEDGELYGDQS